MRESKELTGRQALTAVVAVVLLAHVVPLLGMVMIPVVAVTGAARALGRTAGGALAPR